MEKTQLTPEMMQAQWLRPKPIEFVKYFKLLWSRKYWILIITLALTVIWYFFYSIFLDKPEYTSISVIRFSDPVLNRNVAAVTEFGVIDAQGKIAVLTTNSFLGRVVDSLNYCIIVKNHDINPAELVKKFNPKNSTSYGTYHFVNKGNSLSVYFTGSATDQNRRLLQYLPLTDKSVSFTGNDLEMVLDFGIMQRYNELQFNYIPRQLAIEALRKKLEISPNRTQSILTLSYKDKNPAYSATVINKIASLFTAQLLEYKKVQTTTMIEYLQNQQVVARTELDAAETELQKFRELYPFVFLAGDRQQLVTQVADLEGGLVVEKKNQEQIKQLLERARQNTSVEGRSYIYQELLAYLQNVNVPGAATYSQQYLQLIGLRQRYINENFSAEHPMLINAENQIRDMENQIYSLAANYNNQVKNNLSKSEQATTRFYYNLKSLPRNELKLAELERNRQIKEKILSNILTRMDEAKVADAATIPDAYIIDSAVTPLVVNGLAGKLKKYALGVVLGFVLSVLSFIFVDVLDKSVRSAKDLSSALDLPVLAVIPVIGSIKDLPAQIDSDTKVTKGKIDSKLITTNYTPDQENESFRRLRTKLTMDNDNNLHMLITSLYPNEGKSLLSSNLAIAFAQQKHTTLLVDGDLRRGVLHHSFGVEKRPGLTDLLMKSILLKENQISKALQETHVPNLTLLASGTAIPNPSELLGGKNMKDLFNYLSRKFNVILVDTPPFHLIPDAFVLNKIIGKIMLIARYRRTRMNELKESLTEFEAIKNNFIGVVINASTEPLRKDKYNYTYYHY